MNQILSVEMPKKRTKINDIETVDDYIKNYCQYGSKIFLLKKLQKSLFKK